MEKPSSAEYRHDWWKRNKERAARYRQNRRAKHAEEMKQYQHEYYAKHREKLQQQQRAWWNNNPDKAAEYCKIWRQRHPDRAAHDTQRAAERMRVKREHDPEGVQQYQRDWLHGHPEKVSQYIQGRRSRVLGAEGSFTSNEWMALCEGYSNQCACCGQRNIRLTVDHIVPLIKGGTNYISNIQPLCKSCNSKKHTKTIRYVKKGATTIHETPQVGDEIV